MDTVIIIDTVETIVQSGAGTASLILSICALVVAVVAGAPFLLYLGTGGNRP